LDGSGGGMGVFEGAAAPDDFEMGPPASDVQCRSSHIGGAESIRLNY
jgi:hypothetical protein